MSQVDDQQMTRSTKRNVRTRKPKELPQDSSPESRAIRAKAGAQIISADIDKVSNPQPRRARGVIVNATVRSRNDTSTDFRSDPEVLNKLDQIESADPVPPASEAPAYDPHKVLWRFSYEDTCRFDPCDDGQQETAEAYGGFDKWKAMGAIDMKTRMKCGVKNLFWVYDHHLVRLGSDDRRFIYKLMRQYVCRVAIAMIYSHQQLLYKYFNKYLVTSMLKEILILGSDKNIPHPILECPSGVVFMESLHNYSKVGYSAQEKFDMRIVEHLMTFLFNENMDTMDSIKTSMMQVEKLMWQKYVAAQEERERKAYFKWKTNPRRLAQNEHEIKVYPSRNPNMTYEYSRMFGLAVEAAFKACANKGTKKTTKEFMSDAPKLQAVKKLPRVKKRSTLALMQTLNNLGTEIIEAQEWVNSQKGRNGLRSYLNNSDIRDQVDSAYIDSKDDRKIKVRLADFNKKVIAKTITEINTKRAQFKELAKQV